MDLFKRFLVAIIGIPLLLFIFYYGQEPLIAFLSILVGVITFEIKNILIKKDIKLGGFIIIYNIIFFLLLIFSSIKWVLLFAFVVTMISSAKDIFSGKLNGFFSRLSSKVFIFVYPALFVFSIYKIRQFNKGEFIVLALIILTWVTDSFAYFIGMTLGKHRGFIKASPKKSLEGFAGGFICTLITGLLFLYFLPNIIATKNMIFIIFATGIFGQFGDLFESTFKRDFDVKDSSNILPGHGGVLDRFDSLLISAPTLFFMILILGG